MGLEAATHISQLNATNPVGASDQILQGDDHIRMIKQCLLNDFPNISSVVNATPAQLNLLVGLAALTGTVNLVASNSPALTGSPTVNGVPIERLVAVKPADLARTTALAADPNLTVALLAGAIYEYTMQAMWISPGGPPPSDFAVNMTYSNTKNYHRVSVMWQPSSVFSGTEAGGNLLETAGGILIASNSTAEQVVRIQGLISTINAGNLVMGWGVKTVNGQTTTLQKGSHLIARRIA